MNDLQIFENPEFGQVRTVEINGTPWLVGKDVATALGYKNPRDAITRHVDAEDKDVVKHDTPSGEQEMLIINESGLYSLILSSKMPKAKAFKRWVTSEVLPAIREHGAYESVKAKQHIEQLEATNTRLNTAIAAVNDAKKNLAIARENHDFYVERRNETKNLLADVRALHAKNCDKERHAAQVERDWQNYLDAQINQLQVVAIGLPGFDEILATALETALPDKKEAAQ
jgi:prophage antirepressor-like protein|nr:MAG TPA: repressor domain protein [Caudoviricetes sp.]